MHVALHKLELLIEHVTRQRHRIKAILSYKQNTTEHFRTTQYNTIQCNTQKYTKKYKNETETKNCRK